MYLNTKHHINKNKTCNPTISKHLQWHILINSTDPFPIHKPRHHINTNHCTYYLISRSETLGLSLVQIEDSSPIMFRILEQGSLQNIPETFRSHGTSGEANAPAGQAFPLRRVSIFNLVYYRRGLSPLYIARGHAKKWMLICMFWSDYGLAFECENWLIEVV